MLTANGEAGIISIICDGPDDLTAGLAKALHGPPALVRVDDDSGDWIVTNRNAANAGLPTNARASLMAGRILYGDCLVCRQVSR